jgi:hypothetical protein
MSVQDLYQLLISILHIDIDAFPYLHLDTTSDFVQLIAFEHADGGKRARLPIIPIGYAICTGIPQDVSTACSPIKSPCIPCMQHLRNVTDDLILLSSLPYAAVLAATSEAARMSRFLSGATSVVCRVYRCCILVAPPSYLTFDRHRVVMHLLDRLPRRVR